MDDAGDLAAETAELGGRMQDDGSLGTADALEDGRHVERDHGAQVEHLRVDAFLGQRLGGSQRLSHRPAVGDDGHVLAVAFDVGLAERDPVVALGHRARREVGAHRLEEHHRIRVMDRRQQQTLRLRRRAGIDDLDARHVRKPGLERLRVLRAEAADEACCERADDERYAGLAARHVAQLGGVVAHLVHADHQEVVDHDLCDRLHAGHRRTDGRAHDRLLGDRRRTHTVAAELRGEPVGGLDHAARRICDVFAEQENILVGLERDGQRLVDRLTEGHHAIRLGLVLDRGLGLRGRDHLVGDQRLVGEHVGVELAVGGCRCLTRVLARRIDLMTGRGFDLLERRIGRDAVIDQSLAEAGYRGDRLGGGERGGIHVSLIAAERVALQSMADGFDERRTLARTRAGDGGLGDLMHGDRVGAVDAHAGHLIGCGALREILGEGVFVECGVLSVLIVLADEDDR